MKTIRLLPIVIFAAAALLVFKGIGLVTNGGYVLIGTSTVQAAGGGGGHSGGGSKGGEAPAEGGDGSATLTDHTMSDSSPTAEDSSPTMSLEDEAAAGDGHGGKAAAKGDASAEHGSEEAPAGDEAVACPPVDATAATTDGAAASTDAAPAADAEGHSSDAAAADPCEPAQVTAEGDAIPMMMGPEGKLIPVAGSESSEAAVLERLGERRTELDKREEELALRMALVDAAEKRINEKSALLEQMQGAIDSSVDQAKSGEEAQFKSVVAMYETMKPKEAAAIFNELDINTLLRVAVAMNPRKMAPIMAKMDPIKAKDLTTAMAIAPTEPTVAVTAEDIAALPQIVGQ